MDESLDIRTKARNHGGSVKGKKQKLRCYTRKQLRAIHPAGYVLKGECLAAEVSAEDEPILSPPKTYSRWKYKEKGYWSCGGNRYVALMQPALPTRLLWLLATAVLAVCAVLTVVFWPQISENLPVLAPESKVVLDPHAQDYVGEKTNPNKGNPDAANTQIPGYESIKIDAASGELSIAPHNPEGNPCYFVISLLVEGQEVYKSGMIAPGQALYHVTADPIPAKGTYQATVQYHCFHLTTQAPLNGAEINVELIVN